MKEQSKQIEYKNWLRKKNQIICVSTFHLFQQLRTSVTILWEIATGQWKQKTNKQQPRNKTKHLYPKWGVSVHEYLAEAMKQSDAAKYFPGNQLAC